MTNQELQADAKLVYNGSLLDVIKLADKYGVTTSSLAFYRDDKGLSGQELAVAAFGTASKQKEIRSKLYATIKGQMR